MGSRAAFSRPTILSASLLALVVGACSRSTPPLVATAAPETPADAAKPSPVPEAPERETVPEIDEGEWIGSFHAHFDPDPACRWSADCWHAPAEKPKDPAPAPFGACHAAVRSTELDETSTKKARIDTAKDACCHLSRTCKLPLPKPKPF